MYLPNIARAVLHVGAAVGLLLLTPASVSAQGAPPSSGPADYATFTKGLTPQKGLFTLWRKGGKAYIELTKSQLDTDFIETEVPSSGLGGFGITPGLPYLQFPSARIVRFSRTDDQVAVTWPNTSFIATENTPAAEAVAQSFAPSVIATAPIVAEDATSGAIVIDASFMLKDNLDVSDALRQALNTDKQPGSAYGLDDSRTYFGTTKSFPDNIIVQVHQTFASARPPDAIDNVIDPRTVGIDVKYNIARAPALGTYMPRYADDRVGYYPNIQLQYDSDRVRERQVREIVRWNVARHPMVYYISDTVPLQYRDTIRKALLTWNNAFARIGYLNAVIVKDQPTDDPSWDPDDIRYNTVHWLTQAYGGGYAQAGLVWDPRTGEMIHTSIVLDADLARFGYLEGATFTQPTRSLESTGFARREAAYAAGAKASAMFGLAVLQAQDEIPEGSVPPSYAQDFVRSIVLHESGHNWGLQHNFIASEAYTSAQVRSKAFTSKYGLANSVMEYTPTNVWPRGMSTGDYFQTVLGPYDYYAIKYGYAVIPGATTPEQERPTLRRWASAWSNPWYRFAMDEDVQWESGHAIDPRVAWFDLTNDNLSWCESQLRLGDTLTHRILTHFAQYGDTHDPMRQAFSFALSPVQTCSGIAAHYIGGEDLSRAHVGDPSAQLPLVPVARAESQRAFALLSAHLFSSNAWNVSPQLLRSMVYTEWVTDLPQPAWAYNPPLRHDVPLADFVLDLQKQTLESMFNPVVLQRLDDFSLKYAASGTTMSLADLFSWTQSSVFGTLHENNVARDGEITRNLQQAYARMLVQMLVAPEPGTPYDAQALARARLVDLAADVRRARRLAPADSLESAHLDLLAALTEKALNAQMVAPAAPPPAP